MAKRKPNEIIEVDLDAIPDDVDHVDLPNGSTLDRVKETPLPPDVELTHIYNEDTREMRQVTTRAGYAPAPMPFGFRLATAAEIEAHKGEQDE